MRAKATWSYWRKGASFDRGRSSVVTGIAGVVNIGWASVGREGRSSDARGGGSSTDKSPRQVWRGGDDGTEQRGTFRHEGSEILSWQALLGEQKETAPCAMRSRSGGSRSRVRVIQGPFATGSRPWDAVIIFRATAPETHARSVRRQITRGQAMQWV